MDVEVRGTLNGLPVFVLVECKDHVRPVGIGFVDAFESKVRDLKADRAMMFSNSGFTNGALKKASRVGIEMASAMKAKQDTVRIQVLREVFARRFTVLIGAISVYPFDGRPHEIEEQWKPEDLMFDGLSLVHWVGEKVTGVALKHDASAKIVFLCTFRPERRWSYRGQALMIGGLTFKFCVKKDWVSQTVSEHVSLGYYDQLKRTIVIPPNQVYVLGHFDENAWEETDGPPEDEEIAHSTFHLSMAFAQTNLPNVHGMCPRVDDLIAEQRLEFE